MARLLELCLGWFTPYERIKHLRKNRDPRAWVKFRDLLMARWSNLNIICGLIMGAASSIVFAGVPLSRGSFALGIISLLSSLISIGFGVGMVYVLGDVPGTTLRSVNDSFPGLYTFALSIPEMYAFLSFIAFFVCVGIIVWESPEKGWITKAGTAIAGALLVFHTLGFAWLFREQPTAEYLAAEHGMMQTAEPPLTANTMVDESSAQYLSKSPVQDTFDKVDNKSEGKLTSEPPALRYEDPITVVTNNSNSQ